MTTRPAPITDAQLAEAGTKIMRLRLALKIMRDWSGQPNFDSRVTRTIHGWIDAGMNGPVPWPTSLFFADWAEENGISNIDGFVGYRVTGTLLPAPDASAQE